MKDIGDRVRECIRIREQLFEFGLLAPQQLVDDMNAFVREGTPTTGKVFVPRAGRILEYVLSTKHPCSAVLKAR